jgi:hypothetical protein
MELHDRWAKAKKDSEKKFGDAYKNWCKKIEDDIKKGGQIAATVREKIHKERLKVSGLEKGSSFAAYCTFSAGFGSDLDKLQRMIKETVVKGKDIPIKKANELLHHRDKCLATALAYSREATAYGKRWGDLNPDFWTPLMEALNAIVKWINSDDGLKRMERFAKGGMEHYTFL